MNEAVNAAEAASRYVDPTPDKVAKSRRAVRIWLYSVAFLVFVMVIVGGATRLTDSGLSITEWKPIHGAIPPLNNAEWLEEFEKYKQIPEYQQINKGMSLDEFKFIFWWEWGHRQLGRFIGVAFFVPMMFFWLTRRVSDGLKPKLIVLLILGGLQGGIGWWMVASGLVERTDVSQYRLATHLTLASVIFIGLLWVARGYRKARELRECVSADRHDWFVSILLLLSLSQIFLGGFVAGTDAGFTYNTWPLIDGSFIPDRIYDTDPFWLAAFEDIMTIQFNHRMTAYLLLILTAWCWNRIWRDAYAAKMTIAATVLVVAVFLQAIGGIVTLLLVVPLHMGLVHQGGAIVVLAAATILLRDLFDNSQRYK